MISLIKNVLGPLGVFQKVDVLHTPWHGHILCERARERERESERERLQGLLLH